MSGSDGAKRQLDLACASPVMYAALCEVHKLTASLSKKGDAMSMKQVLTVLNVVNDKLYRMLAGKSIG